ncbi:D-amino acid dehydrogenase small subunit [mine drainage metagenome]|uniref:D-amino acid dehydrogenase small subunit n=1 Tax=mine drainage metagenome TaxID=410659 RepID=A0A1J5PSC6_9ZZZZ
MACGSGRLVTDLVLGRTPDISTAGLGLDRYASTAIAPRPLRSRPA